MLSSICDPIFQDDRTVTYQLYINAANNVDSTIANYPTKLYPQESVFLHTANKTWPSGFVDMINKMRVQKVPATFAKEYLKKDPKCTADFLKHVNFGKKIYERFQSSK